MSGRIDNPRAPLKSKIQQLAGPLLVLGASGFVGANLFRALIQERDDLTGTAGELPAWRLQEFPDRTIRLVDVLDDRQLDALLDDVNPRTVFNCIAYGAYPFEVDAQRIYDTNFRFLTRLLPRLASRETAAFIHAGTSSEYGTNAAGPDEEAFAAPNSDYAVSKIAAAKLIYFYGKRHHLPCANLRLYSVYGPLEDSSRLVPQLILQGAEGRLPEFVNPEISRDFLYVGDAVAAFVDGALSLDESHWGESFNIGTGREVTIREVAAIAGKMFHIAAQPSFTMPARDWDVCQWFAKNDRARSVLGWEPTVSFQEGLEQTWAWFRAFEDKQAYLISTKKKSCPKNGRAPDDVEIPTERSVKPQESEKRLFNLNSLSNGADQTLLHYARRCLEKFEGPLVGVEMGVAWGGGIEALAQLWKRRGTVYGYDTFEGHPAHLSSNPESHEARCMEAHYRAYGRRGLSYEYQRRHLDHQGLTNAVLVKGLVSQRSCDALPPIHYCLLDLDMAVSMIPAYAAVQPKIVAGGYLCIHDYIGHPEITWFLREIVMADGIWNVDREFPDQDLIVLERRDGYPETRSSTAVEPHASKGA